MRKWLQLAAAITAEFSHLSPAEQAMLAELCKKLGRGRPNASSSA